MCGNGQSGPCEPPGRRRAVTTLTATPRIAAVRTPASARMRRGLRRLGFWLTVLILIARMTPALSYLIPLFTVFQFLGLNNTLSALVITHLVITVPIVVYIMAGYFETLPKELEEAALIDGGSAWTLFRYVALPLARPGIVVGTILAFIFSWNNFVFGAVLAGRATRTLPAAVYNVLTFEQLAWGPLAAAAIVVTLPVLLLTIAIQKEIVVGLTHGGVKGG